MISVVMATYNGERYVEKQLQSILNQSLMPDEVIIRDDGSNDSTVQIVQEFIKKHNLSSWEIKINEENLGYRKNFANLLSLANGDYIFLSDQDDEWLGDKIEKMSTIFKENNDIQALNGKINLIDANSNKIEVVQRKNVYNANFYFSKSKLKKLNKVSLAELAIANITPGCAMAITKKLRDLFLDYYDARLPHDWYLNMLAAYDNGCYFLNESVINYRIHANNTSGAVASEGITHKLQVFEQEKKQRMGSYQLQIEAISEIENNLGNLDNKTKVAQLFLKTRLEFYKHPSLNKFLKMCTYQDYRDRTVLKGRVWDLFLALKLNKVIYLFRH